MAIPATPRRAAPTNARASPRSPRSSTTSGSTDDRARALPGAGGALLTYRDFGDGRPLVLFSGDSDDTADLWLPHVDPLVARGHRVVLVDLPDGRSPAGVPTAAGLALLDHLATADDLAGYDLGGHGGGALRVVRMSPPVRRHTA